MHKKNIKIVKLYIISLICIVCYFLLENSTIIPELVQISEKGRYSGFPTFFLTGLFKYGLLLVGIGIILILTFLLIRERTKKTIE
jgi:hypothetical protein